MPVLRVPENLPSSLQDLGTPHSSKTLRVVFDTTKSAANPGSQDDSIDSARMLLTEKAKTTATHFSITLVAMKNS